MKNKCPHCGSYSLINDGWETYCLLCNRQPAPTSAEIAAKQHYPAAFSPALRFDSKISRAVGAHA